MDCNTPGFPVHHQFWSLLKLMSMESEMPSNHLILCQPFLILPQSFPASGLFPMTVLHIRWPKYWSFSFSISPSNDHSRLISFRIHWLDLLASVMSNSLQPSEQYPPGSSIHGIFQARVLEWVAISFSRGSSRPRDRTHVSHIAGRRFNL